MRPASVTPEGKRGSSIAANIIAKITMASKIRSTASEPSAVVRATRGTSRVIENARANSPARSGKTLFIIMPIAVLRHRGPNGMRPATGSRIVRHRRARSGKMQVPTIGLRANTHTFEVRRTVHTSLRFTPRNVHQSRIALNAIPSPLFQSSFTADAPS